MRALGCVVVVVLLVVSCPALAAEAKNEHKSAVAKAGGLNLAAAPNGGSSSKAQKSSDGDALTSALRQTVRRLRTLNEEDEDADRDDEQSQDNEEEEDQNRDDEDNEQQGKYSVQGEYKNDYQGYQHNYKTGGSSSSSTAGSDASADNMSWDASVGGGIAVWSISAVAISMYALVGIRSFYRRYGDRDIYTGAGVPGEVGSSNSLAGDLAGMDDKKINLILPSGRELECDNTVVSAMTGYPAPL